MSSALLYPAVFTGDLDRVKNLLNQEGLDVNVRGRSQLVPLHHAVKLNHVEILDFLLQHPTIDVNAMDKIQRTALHMACRKGHSRIVEKLLGCAEEKGLHVNAQAKGGITPLHLAAHCGNDDAVKMLVAHPYVDLDARTVEEQFTALHLCASSGYDGVVKALVEAHLLTGKTSQEHMEAIINAEDVLKRTPLHYAAWDNRVDVVKELLSYPSIKVNSTDRDGCTALHLASWKGHAEVVELLLGSVEIDPNVEARSNQETQSKILPGLQQDVPWEQLPRPKLGASLFNENRNKMTPLHCAVEEGKTDVVTLLVAHPLTDVLVQNSQRRSAMDIALHKKQVVVLEKLFERIWNKVEECRKLLDRIRNKKGFEDMVDFLLLEIGKAVRELNPEIGASSSTPKTHVSLIHEVAYAGLDKVLEVLLTIPNVDINGEDSDKQTPLHFAAIKGHTDVVKVLIKEESLRANEEDKYSRTALQIAVESERKDIEKLLLERPDVKDYVDRLYRDRQVYVDAANAILVGAALIASVTFAGWLQPPLGYTPYYEFVVPDPAPPGTFESYAAVKQHISARVFWVCNSLSFFSAIATVIAGAGAVLPMLDVFIGEEVRVVRRSLVLTSVLLVFAVVFVLGAFAAAGFASLPPIRHLQLNMIITCCIGVLLCVSILVWFLRRLYRLRPTWWRAAEKSFCPHPGAITVDRFFFIPS